MVFLDTIGLVAASLRAAIETTFYIMRTFTSKSELEDYTRKSKRVLILFCASWCPFCQGFFPSFEKGVMKKDFDMVQRVYIDDYDNPLWEEYDIEAVPAVMLFEEGRVRSRLDAKLGSGLSEKKFIEWLGKV